ncbi:MAG TPA: DUF167 domain-containing protein [Acidimicrobiia bacterium]|nr:DUF167 domain-containing protein [Acidimicrobiia bacterium]
MAHDVGPVVPVEGGVDLIVWVVPGASRSEVAGLYGDALRVRVTQAPERGRANVAAGELLTQALGARVELVGGATSRRKRFRAMGLSAGAVRAALGV